MQRHAWHGTHAGEIRSCEFYCRSICSLCGGRGRGRRNNVSIMVFGALRSSLRIGRKEGWKAAFGICARAREWRATVRVSESPPLLVPGVSAPSAPAAATASSPRTTSGRRGRRSTTCAASPAPSAPSSSRPARSSTSSPARTTPCSARTTTSRTTAARPPVSHESRFTNQFGGQLLHRHLTEYSTPILGRGFVGAPFQSVVRQTLDRPWTGSPIFVQTLSNLCPMSVHVQGLSVCCPTNPNKSTWTKSGQS